MFEFHRASMQFAAHRVLTSAHHFKTPRMFNIHRASFQKCAHVQDSPRIISKNRACPGFTEHPPNIPCPSTILDASSQLSMQVKEFPSIAVLIFVM